MRGATTAGFVTFVTFSFLTFFKETGANACDSGGCWLAQCKDILGAKDCSDCKPGAVHAATQGSPSQLDCVNDVNAVCDTAPWTIPRLSNACHDENSCPWGYTWSESSRSCVDADECALGTHRCGSIAQCVNVPGIYVCVCPKLQDHYVGTFTGSYRFSKKLQSCIDDTADPVCSYPLFRYNGTCVLDACFGASCDENEMCMTSVDGKSAECTCIGDLDEEDNCTAPFSS